MAPAGPFRTMRPLTPDLISIWWAHSPPGEIGPVGNNTESAVLGDRAMGSDGSVKAGVEFDGADRQPVFLLSVWQWMVRHPVISVLLILAIQTIPTLWSRDLRPVDELRHAAVLIEMLDHGNWLALHLNGEYYPDKPPVFFWFAAAIVWLFGTDSAPVFFLITAVSGGLLLVATYQMARLVGHGSKQFGLIACLLLLANAFFIERAHYPRMDLLFSTFISLSLTAFFVAFERHRSLRWTLAGFGFATLAALTKGPFGFATPALTAILFLAATRNLRRLVAYDMGVGAILTISLMLLYFLGLYWAEGEAYLRQIFGYVDDKAGWSAGFNFGLDDYAYFLVLRWLPWTLLLFFIPWRPVLRSLAPGNWGNSQNAGWIYLGLSIICTLLPISIISYVHPNFLIIILPPIAVLSAAAIREVPSGSLRWFITFVAGILFILGVAFPIVTTMDSAFFLVPYGYSSGAIAVIAAILMFRTRRDGFAPFIMILTAGATLISLLHFIITNPTGDSYKSTKPASTVIAEYIDEGYVPFSFGYPGYGSFFQYYAGHRLPEYDDWDRLNEELQHHDRAVIVSSQRAWDLWRDRPPEARIVHRSPRNPSIDHYDNMSRDPYVFVVEKK